MSPRKEPERDGDVTAQFKRELREEALRLRDEFFGEWQQALADQGSAKRGGARGGQPRGGRRGREPLTRERIVDAAMKIMEKDGLDKVNMRKIAWELDTGPASIYGHVRSMAELHGLLLDRLLANLELEDDTSDWREALAGVVARYVRLLIENPELARSAVAARPSGHHYLALVERLLSLMDEGGIDMARAAWGVDLILAWATASAAEHAESAETGPQETEWEALRTAVSHADRYPHVAALGLDLVGGTGEQRAQWTLNALINGIAATPRD